MSEPPRLDLGDWALTVLAGIFIGILSGLGTAMAWFRGSKARIYDRIEGIEQEMTTHQRRAGEESRDLWKANNEHEAQLRVLTNCQANTVLTLARMERAMEKQGEKLDELVREKRKN